VYFQNGTAKQYSLKPKSLSQSLYLEGVRDWRLGRVLAVSVDGPDLHVRLRP